MLRFVICAAKVLNFAISTLQIVVSSLIVLAAAIGKAVLGKEAVDWIQLGWFMVSYLAAFILAFLTIQKIEERRAKKIEEKYDDDDK